MNPTTTEPTMNATNMRRPNASAPPATSTTDRRAGLDAAAVNDCAHHRPLALAILSTLSAACAAWALDAIETFARAIVDAATLLEHRPESLRSARAIVRAGCRAFDARGPDGSEPAVQAYALVAAWWFNSPYIAVKALWQSPDTRACVASKARGVLVELEALRAARRPAAGSPASLRSVVAAGVEGETSPPWHALRSELAAYVRDHGADITDTPHGRAAESLRYTVAVLGAEDAIAAQFLLAADSLAGVINAETRTAADRADDGPLYLEALGESSALLARLVAAVQAEERRRPGLRGYAFRAGEP